MGLWVFATILSSGIVPVLRSQVLPKPPIGFEPMTYALQVRCSTTEPRRHVAAMLWVQRHWSTTKLN